MSDSHARTGTLRLAELVATLSLATDLGRGQPMEHCVRQTVIALSLADLLGLDEDERTATYYTGLLVSVYCHADAHEQVHWFGDDIAIKAATYDADMESPRALLRSLRWLGSSESGLTRARRMLEFPLRGIAEVNQFLHTHAALQSEFAQRLGLPDPVVEALAHCYERWDGRGVPIGMAGRDIPIAARIVNLADLVEVHHRIGGVAAARAVVHDRAGGHLDPELAALFSTHASQVLAQLAEPGGTASWGEVLAAEPGLARTVAGDELDGVLEAMGDLVDMKSPFTAGHSRGVAHLAAEAARGAGLPADDVATVRRAGFLHDLGRLGISNAIWDKRAALSAGETEKARLHAYLGDRMLAAIPALAPARRVAARHHERCDGSGYPGGLTRAELSPSDCLLAAADCYHALTEPRPQRDALGPDAAAALLHAEVRAGRIDDEAAQAVLAAAGHRAPRRRTGPDGLTAREVEVLTLLARGHSNKEIARALVVSPKTASSHIEHIYTKIRVNSRAAATLYATTRGLVGSYEPAAEDRVNTR